MEKLSFVLPVGAGLLIGIQLYWENKARIILGSPIPIAFCAFSLALIATLCWALYTRVSPWPSWQHIEIYQVAFGGPSRVLYLWLMLLSAGRIGLGMTFAVAISAQLLTGFLIDYTVKHQAVSDPRQIIGLLSLGIGIWLLLTR